MRKLSKPDPLSHVTLVEIRDIVAKITGNNSKMLDLLESEISALRLKRMNDNAGRI